MVFPVECPVPVEELLHVEVEPAVMPFREGTAVSLELPVVRIAHAGRASLVKANTYIIGELEVPEEGDLREGCTVEGVSFAVVHIQGSCLEGVGIRLYRTAQSGVACITVVVHL